MSFYPFQAQNFSLAGAGCSIGDTVLNLKSFKDIVGNNITMADLGTVGEMTIEPGNGTQEEAIQFTGVTQNSDGSAQLTGVSMVLFKTPYTSTSGIRVTHPGSVVAILTNTAAFYNQFAILANDEAITGNWTVPTGVPVSNGSLASKAFVLSVASGSPISTDRVVVAGTAGESVTAGKIIYIKSDGKWYNTTASGAAASINQLLGISQSTASANAVISGGILVKGLDSNQSGLSTGSAYYLSNTPGAIALAAGTNSQVVGVAKDITNLYFDPYFIPASTLVTATSIQNSSQVYAADGGGSDAYAITPTPATTAYVTGQRWLFKANTANTGTATLAVSGLTATPIVKNKSAILSDNDIRAGQIVEVVYDGTNFQMVSPIANTTSLITAVTTPVSVASSTSLTDLVSTTVPANTLGTTGIVELTAYFDALQLDTNGGGTGANVTFTFTYGTTSTTAVFTNQSGAANTTAANGIIKFTVYGTGATNAQLLVGEVIGSIPTGNGSTAVAGSMATINSGTATEDSTAAKALKLSVTFNHSSAASQITLKSAIVRAS